MEETEADILRDLHEKQIFVGMASGIKMVGCVRMEMLPSGIAYLSRLAVLTQWQQYGLGKLLVNTVEQEAIRLGAGAVALHTAKKITRLVRFYQRLGYTVRATGNARGYARVLFAKELQNTPADFSAWAEGV